MPRSVNSVASRQRRKKILKQAKGYFGRRKNVWTVAKNAVEKGLSIPWYVKTSLSPGSRVVLDYLNGSGLMKYFEDLTYEEMAVLLGGTSGSLKASFHHAAKKIEAFLINSLNHPVIQSSNKNNDKHE